MIPTSPQRPSFTRSPTDALGASLYGPLAYSSFGLRQAALPDAVSLPQSVNDAVAEPIPDEYDFALETVTVEQWNRLQNRKFAEAKEEEQRLKAEAERKEAERVRRQESEWKAAEAREAAEAEAAIQAIENAERDARRREAERVEAARREMEENQKAASLAVAAAEEEGRRLEAEAKRMREEKESHLQAKSAPPSYHPSGRGSGGPPAYSAAGPPPYIAAGRGQPPAYSAANPFNDPPAGLHGGPAAAVAEAKSSPGPYDAMNFPPEHAPKLQQMLSHTGADMEVCRTYLQDANYDVNQAINKYWDSH